MRRLLSQLRPLAPYRVQAGILLLAVAIAAATGGVLVAREGGSGESGAVPEAGVENQGERDTSFLARIVPPPADDGGTGGPRVPRTVGDLVRRLPVERKVAQLFLVGFPGKDLTSPIFQQLRRLDLGGIVIDRRNYDGPQTLGTLAGETRVIAGQEHHVPPWVMAPQEGGEFSAFRDLPPAGSPADIASPADAGRTAAVAGKTLRELGVTGVLAPVIDVGLETDPALGARVFSDNAVRVAQYAVQSVTAYDRQRMFSAVKHFPGLGTASQPTEEGPAQVGLSDVELEDRDLVPFRAAFRAGAPGVVLSHALYTVDDFTIPGSLSRKVVTGLLRDRLKFRGVAITDDLADPGITALESVPHAAVKAVQAGADMLWISGSAGDQQAAYVAVLQAVRRRRISRRRLDEAVGRLLTAKRRFGMIS
ncbi:MAG TPA: glycoside hydrolase family 3 N-terminal domain-containing protein [Thermoleophilaceae bacterium]|nr:glycoside hydrolase family 3 N-terminal domain-containing protein [Thermoleophilaceae bacterium]